MLHGKCAGVASFDTPKAIGEYIGTVESLTKRGFKLDKANDLSAGDGICIITREGLKGTNINTVNGSAIEPNRMDGIVAGAKVYRNYDHRFNLSLDNSRSRRTVESRAKLQLSEQGCTLTITDEQGIAATVSRDIALAPANNAEKMAATARRQIEKSGDTIFSIAEVKVSGAEYFAPASLLSEMRREALEKLLVARKATPRHHKIIADSGEARYPYLVVTRYENVTNQRAREFYLQHGAEEIESALECQPTQGERVMISSYCIRREIGECLKQNPKLRGDLYIEHGTARYRLEFDCQRCLMMLIDCSTTQPQKKR